LQCRHALRPLHATRGGGGRGAVSLFRSCRQCYGDTDRSGWRTHRLRRRAADAPRNKNNLQEDSMAELNDVFEIMGTTRSMRRLKPDPVPDELICKILEAGPAPPMAATRR